MVKLNTIELLAPGKDSASGIAAVRCGADAVYIGGGQFGARQAAGNSTADIKSLADYAHLYYAKVYAAVNTLLRDDELTSAQELIYSLYEAGIDGVIIQDMGLLKLDLPPLPLIASTQMHNNTAEKVKFLEDVGFSRVILARELTLDQIREIRRQTKIELECFIHGALCVGTSGQCYMSYAAGGRSGNRGQCAQPCRKLYNLSDESGEVLSEGSYLLSLKDLNLSQYLEQLIDAGITSFKIEGRLKNIPYVTNITGHYRGLLDAILPAKGLKAASSGKVKLGFTPDPAKTFNRGYTDYGITSKTIDMGSIKTPKSMGEPVGKVSKIGLNYFELDGGGIELHNADGICFFADGGELGGTVVNRVEGTRIYPQKMDFIIEGVEIFRNLDHQFTKLLETVPANRKIAIGSVLKETTDGIELTIRDEDGNEAAVKIQVDKEPAKNAEMARQNITKQLSKFGETIFECSDVQIETTQDYFFAVSLLNGLRRDAAEAMLKSREANRKRPQRLQPPCISAAYPQKELDYTGNVLNEKAMQFYLEHGVEKITPAAESGLDMRGRKVMTTKYCIRRQLGMCTGKDNSSPLLLTDENGNRFKLIFNCGECGMDVVKV